MLNRKTVVGLFVGVWLFGMFLLFSRSQPEDSPEMREITRQLRRALDNVEDLSKKNKQLKDEAISLRKTAFDQKVAQVGSEVDDMNDKLKDAKLSKDQCMDKVQNLETAVQELRSLQSQGQDFVQGGKHGVIATPGSGPSYDHEMARFKVTNNVQELWFYTKSQLKKLNNDAANKILDDIGHRHRSIEVDLMTLSNVDNNQDWRENEHRELQDLMQRRIYNLQNPQDCSKAKKLVCDLNKGCGFGCQLHHAIYCFMIAYGTERTMILQSRGWRYASKGWDSVFKPVSDSCTDVSEGQTKRNWNGESQTKDVDVVVMPIVDALHARPPYMPLSFPEDLAQRLQTLHGDPSVWFISQFVKYLMRPQKHLQDDIDSTKEKMNFKNPIVGIHVRRTDKVGTEAAFHGIEEYMEHVDQWFMTQERIPNKIDKRRVYIASDDPSVLPEARKKYPDYEFFGDTSISQSAGMSSRYTDNSLRGVIIDIQMLSMTDYLVCTFSSQVCRVAYEIMQTLHPDPSHWFHSLDDIYYFGGQGGHEETVLYKHYPDNRDEIALEPGDIVGIAGNHWDGYSKGSNKRTGAIGLYPSYKTEDKKVIVKYPTYVDVPLTET